MALVLPPVLAALLARLRQRYRVLAPLALLALVRYVYHKRQRHLEQLRVHRKIIGELAHARHVVRHHTSEELHHVVPIEELLSPMEEWHDVAEGAQTQSIVYHALPDAATGKINSDYLVLILPGNPGLSHYYLPLMRELVQRHGRRHEVRCMSHTGHFMPWKNNGREFTFQEQIEHKCNYVAQRIAENPTLKLVIICHSIGAYVTLKVAERFPSHIAKLCLMQPTITHIGKTTKGTALMPFFRYRKHSIKIIHLLEFLFPIAVRQWLIRLAIGGSNEDVLHHATLSLVNRSVMRNVLLMAFHEMQQVGDLDDELVKIHEEKTLFVYSPMDDWVPNEYVQGYQTRFGKARHRMLPQSHGFMMDKHGTRDMAEHISQWISDVLDQAFIHSLCNTAGQARSCEISSELKRDASATAVKKRPWKCEVAHRLFRLPECTSQVPLSFTSGSFHEATQGLMSEVMTFGVWDYDGLEIMAGCLLASRSSRPPYFASASKGKWAYG